MDKTRIASILILVAILGLAFWLLFRSTTSWYPTLNQQSEEPYGLASFKKIVERSAGSNNYVEWTTSLEELEDSISASSYIFAGREFYGDSAEASYLKAFVEKGGKAFISINDDAYLYYVLFNWNMWDYVPEYNAYDYDEYDYDALRLRRTDTVLTQFLSSEDSKPYSLYFRNQKSSQDISVYGFEKGFIPDTVDVLGEAYIPYEGTFDTLINCLRIPIGQNGGEVIMHTMPIAFSNISLQEEEGFQYAQQALGNLSMGVLVWDQFNSYPKFGGGGGSGFSDKNELQYIKEKKGFRLAWLTLVFGSLAFLLLGLRRKARPIPLIQEPLNRSVGFARSLGALYLKAGKPRHLASEMMRLFDNYNRRKFSLVRNVEDKEASIKMISERTGVDQALIKRIVDKEWELRFNPQISPKELIPLHKDLQQYYQHLEK